MRSDPHPLPAAEECRSSAAWGMLCMMHASSLQMAGLVQQACQKQNSAKVTVQFHPVTYLLHMYRKAWGSTAEYVLSDLNCMLLWI